MDSDSLAKVMLNCGLKFLGFKRSTGIPVFAAGMVTSRHPDEGRQDRTVSLEDPDFVAKANADWYALATEFGLFSVDRRFLLSVDLSVDLDDVEALAPDEPGECVWALVELLDNWDIVGVGAASGITGRTYGDPAFVMSAVDGSVFVQGTMWQDSIGTAVLPTPHRVRSLRDVVRLNVGKLYRTVDENEDALLWLAREEDEV